MRGENLYMLKNDDDEAVEQVSFTAREFQISRVSNYYRA